MTDKPNNIEKDDRKICHEHFQGKTESIFEAIMVIGTRARQINRENKEEFDELLNNDKDDSEMFTDASDYDMHSRNAKADLPKYPKPERVAIKELLNDELDFRYEEISDIE